MIPAGRDREQDVLDRGALDEEAAAGRRSCEPWKCVEQQDEDRDDRDGDLPRRDRVVDPGEASGCRPG